MFKIKEISKMTYFIQMGADALLAAVFPKSHKSSSPVVDMAAVKGGKVALCKGESVSVIDADDYDSLVEAIDSAADTGEQIGLRISKSNWRRWKQSQA